ncbi:MAG: hypothetical protein N4A45_10995 [Flavobacteriales bacterium]|jgi:hypothetical protein|nr:hypothetical protein [Flavobacteriales bacterium]
MKKILLTSFLLSILISILSISCSKEELNPNNEFIGKWKLYSTKVGFDGEESVYQASQSNETVTKDALIFTQDLEFTWKNLSGSLSEEGVYTLSNPKSGDLIFPYQVNLGGTVINEVNIKNDTLHFFRYSYDANANVFPFFRKFVRE